MRYPHSRNRDDVEKITLQDIVDAVDGIDTKRFVDLLETFIKAIAREAAEEPLTERRQAHRADHADTEARHDEIRDRMLQTATQILTHATIAVSHIINFHFAPDGRATGVTSIDEKTSSYFRKIRKHQIELLLTIGNEVAILRDTVKHCRRMQRVFHQNVRPVAHASRFMSIVRERIEARPTTLLRLNGTGGKIERLNAAFADIQTYEDTYHQKIRREVDLNPISDAMTIYGDLTADTIEDMNHLKRRLKADSREFTKGKKLMIKLATKGYSPFMKKSLDALVESHGHRTREFTAAVCESRRNYYVDDLI